MQQHGVEFNVLCTVHAQNADHPLEVYRFFRDELGARFIQFIPIVERVNSRWPRTLLAGRRSLSLRSGIRSNARGLGPLSDRDLRRVGQARRRHGVRADVRRRARFVGRRAAVDVHLR